MQLSQMGAGRSFSIAVLTIRLISTFGTVVMTAVPFSVAPMVHKSGIGLYFLGVVFLQSVIFIKQWRMKEFPRLLPLTGIVMVAKEHEKCLCAHLSGQRTQLQPKHSSGKGATKRCTRSCSTRICMGERTMSVLMRLVIR